MKASHLRVSLAIAAIFVIFGLFRINDLSLYTDSTRYLIWGHSLSQLNGYVDNTQPIPSHFVMNAPLYPLLLVPVEWAFPFSVEAAKIWTLLLSAFALVMFFRWLERHFSLFISSIVTIGLALNPLFFTVSTEILSEGPFLVLFFSLLLSAERYLEEPAHRANRLVFFGSLAIVTLMREVGAALVLASLILLFRRKSGKDLFRAGALAAGFFVLWTIRNSFLVESPDDGQTANLQYLFHHFATSDQSSIFTEFATRAWLNLKGYVSAGGALFYPISDNLVIPGPFVELLRSVIGGLRTPLLVVVLIGTGYGVKSDLQSGESAIFRLTALAMYLVIILFYPVHDVRFLLPLLPLLLFYMSRTFSAIGTRFRNGSARTAAGMAAALLLLTPNVLIDAEMIRANARYTSDPTGFAGTLPPESDAHRYFDQPWSGIGAWIRSHTPENALVASPVKEIAPFIYPRKVLETSRVLPGPVFDRFLRDFRSDFLLTVNAWDSVETFQAQMAESRRLWFEPLTRVGGTGLYAVHSVILDPAPSAALHPPDTSTVRGKFLAGRESLLRMRYGDALRYFNECLTQFPAEPEAAFQAATALSLLGDSAGTMSMVEQLFTLPRSTAYSQSMQSVVSLMEQNLKAWRLSTPSMQSYALFETGPGYWGMGYRETARSVIRTVSRLDTMNFVGALWGIYFAKELGDTVESNRFLERLKRIDRGAQIVGDWDAVRMHEEALRKTTSPSQQAALHLQIARVYAKIELFDEALDAVERALKLEPRNPDLWLYLGEVFEAKKAIPGAIFAYREVLNLEPRNVFAAAKLDSLIVN